MTTVYGTYMVYMWFGFHDTPVYTCSLLISLIPCHALTSFLSVFQTSVFVVTDTQRVGELIQHVGYVEKGEIRKGDKLTARINQVNHSPSIHWTWCTSYCGRIKRLIVVSFNVISIFSFLRRYFHEFTCMINEWVLTVFYSWLRVKISYLDVVG